MKKSLLVIKTKLILASKIIVQGLLLLIFSISLCAQNSNAAQWQSAGGEKILSGNHNFTTSWSSDSYSRKEGKYWKGSFYEPANTRNYQPWDNVVKNSVAPIKGTFTVQGPGHIGLYQKSKGGSSIIMYNADTKAAFRPWYGTGNNFDQGEFWGKVPEKAVITIVVEAQMTAYNNQNMTGEYSFRAPQEVKYEVWFFPQDGGKIIKIDNPIAKFDKPKPGILYYKDKVCN